MCLQGCMTQVRERLEREHALKKTETTQTTAQTQPLPSARRGFLKQAFLGSIATFGTAVGVAARSDDALAMEEGSSRKKRMLRRGVKKVIDLTHTFSPAFPTYFGTAGITFNKIADYDKDKYNLYRYEMLEHAGTHLDAPLHFSKDGLSAAEIPAQQLVVPLIKVDLRAKAEQNPDAQLTVEDLKAWEKKHGKIPPRCCVAMDSGWGQHVSGKKFRNADDKGAMHFPGFHAETADFLINERGAGGIAVDTLSLDYGASSDFAMHYAWLPQGKWGLECVANLEQIPAKGAVLVAGVQKFEGGTGGPTRVIALM